jgi:type II secretory ATPase GspE/PulE/Tfp pilus assembly ATPase PilB-like protein
MNEELAGLILRRASHDEIKAAARANGMRTMAEDGFLKCKQGLTTPEEVVRAVFAQT